MTASQLAQETSSWPERFEAAVTRLDRRKLFVIVMLLSAVVYAQFKFWELPSTGDRANWDYFSQVIARGGVPYRDVVNIKSPLSAYIGAAAILAGRPFGISDVYAIRVAFYLIGCLTVGLTFLLALEHSGSRRIALLAALIMLSFNAFARLNGAGVQPKTPMIMFGLLAVLATLKERSFLAGVAGMLSALSWQPGLLFVGASAVAFSRYGTNWRDFHVAKLLAGAAVPLFLLVAYLWTAGVLREAYLWSIHFTLTVYAPRELRSVDGFAQRLTRMLSGPYRGEVIYFLIAPVGLLVVLVENLRSVAVSSVRSILQFATGHSLIIAPLAYFLFCSVNIQGAADMIPFLPFIAIFAAYALGQIVRLGVSILKRWWSTRSLSLEHLGFAALALLIFTTTVADAFASRHGFPKLADQIAEVAQITSELEANDKIYIHGHSEILVLSGLQNASKYFFLDRGKDVYLDQIEPGGFDGWLERLKADKPRIVALERMRTLRRGRDFYDWVQADYHLRDGRIFKYYVRKGDDVIGKSSLKRVSTQ